MPEYPWQNWQPGDVTEHDRAFLRSIGISSRTPMTIWIDGKAFEILDATFTIAQPCRTHSGPKTPATSMHSRL